MVKVCDRCNSQKDVRTVTFTYNFKRDLCNKCINEVKKWIEKGKE